MVKGTTHKITENVYKFIIKDLKGAKSISLSIFLYDNYTVRTVQVIKKSTFSK